MTGRKAKWHPGYYTKKEILELDNHQLLNAFAASIADETNAQNKLARGIPAKLTKQIEWMREEILTRMGK